MTDEIREKMKVAIAAKYPSKRQFAKAVGTSPQYLEAVLAGDKVNVPPIYAQMLDALDLELVVQPKPKRTDD